VRACVRACVCMRACARACARARVSVHRGKAGKIRCRQARRCLQHSPHDRAGVAARGPRPPCPSDSRRPAPTGTGPRPAGVGKLLLAAPNTKVWGANAHRRRPSAVRLQVAATAAARGWGPHAAHPLVLLQHRHAHALLRQPPGHDEAPNACPDHYGGLWLRRRGGRTRSRRRRCPPPAAARTSGTGRIGLRFRFT
jgi:hypothetical protein